MKAKMFFLMCVMGILSASVALAQRGHAGGQPAYDVNQDFDTFLGQLNLTEKQQTKVDELRQQMNTKIEKAKGGKAATQSAQSAFRGKVMDVLTSEQRKKLKEIEAEAKKQHQPQGNGAKKGR